MKCRKCGREASVGDLCDSCMFYETNAQCWRCRLYLPITEMQTYKGMLLCQYCIMDLREDERRAEEHGSMKRPEAPLSEKWKGKKDIYDESTRIVERCERCGKELDIVYIMNDRKLCKSCVEEESKSWKGGGIQPPIIKFRLRGNESFFASLLRIFHQAREILFERKKRKEKGKD